MIEQLLKEIRLASEALLTDGTLQSEYGNKAAGTRARKASLQLERLTKAFRKASLETSKKGVYTKPRLKMKHLSTLFAALVLWSVAGPQGVVAQDQRGDRPPVDRKTTESRHEILPYIRGGVSTLHYKVDNGSRTSGFGFGVGINYVWFFQPRWGLQTGIEWQSYNTRARLDQQIMASRERTRWILSAM